MTMFNLLVSGIPNAWETDQRMRMEISRFKEYSGGEAQDISPKRPESLKVLEDVPALLMYEVSCDGPSAKVVRYGYLRDIRVDRHEVTFRLEQEGHFTRKDLEEFADRMGIQRFEHNRTHWAVKDGDLPGIFLERMIRGPYRVYRYEVALSYAGEDREYVERVAEFLKTHGVELFYAPYEEAALWGKDLAEHFDAVYRKQARYCVIFVSKHYAAKVWPTHERRVALARAIEEKEGEYILLARFDDTEVPGLRPTLAYVDLRQKMPKDFGRVILEKLGRKPAG